MEILQDRCGFRALIYPFSGFHTRRQRFFSLASILSCHVIDVGVHRER